MHLCELSRYRVHAWLTATALPAAAGPAFFSVPARPDTKPDPNAPRPYKTIEAKERTATNLHFWDLARGAHLQEIDLGAQHHSCRCICSCCLHAHQGRGLLGAGHPARGVRARSARRARTPPARPEQRSVLPRPDGSSPTPAPASTSSDSGGGCPRSATRSATSGEMPRRHRHGRVRVGRTCAVGARHCSSASVIATRPVSGSLDVDTLMARPAQAGEPGGPMTGRMSSHLGPPSSARTIGSLPGAPRAPSPTAFGGSAPHTSSGAGAGTTSWSDSSQAPQSAGSSAPSSPVGRFHTDRPATPHGQHSRIRGPPARPWDAIATRAPARARCCSRPEDRRARTVGHRVWREPGRSPW